MKIGGFILRYLFKVVLIFSFLFLFQWFIIENYFYFLEDYSYMKVLCYLFLLLVVNPIITYNFTKTKSVKNNNLSTENGIIKNDD